MYFCQVMAMRRKRPTRGGGPLGRHAFGSEPQRGTETNIRENKAIRIRQTTVYYANINDQVIWGRNQSLICRAE